MSTKKLERLLESRKARHEARIKIDDKIAAIRSAAEDRWKALPEDQRGAASLTEAEEAEYRQLVAQLEPISRELREIDEELPAAQEEAMRDAEAANAYRHLNLLRGADGERFDIRVKSEPTTYGEGGSNSYFRDLALLRDPARDHSKIVERLNRHSQEMDVEMRTASREMRATMSRIDGVGGEFVPPLWLINEYVPLMRASRVAAELVRKLTLPAGTDQILLPKVVSGLDADAMLDNAAVAMSDMTTGSVSAKVETIAGGTKVPLQLIDQSPINMDQILMQDLAQAHAIRTDLLTIYGNGTSPQFQGYTGVSGINAVTYTDASATLPELYAKLIKAQADIAINRLAQPQAILMHPRRWAWCMAQVDSQGRPYVVANPNGPTNAFAGFTDVRAEGSVGSIAGLPVYVSPNVKTNDGVGTDQDQIHICRWDDLYLYEGPIRTRALLETKADNLQVLFQLWNYAAFLPDRYPKAIGVITGTGLNAVL